jgi:aminoglycoside phosphotransferase (APT) family kinase protein
MARHKEDKEQVRARVQRHRLRRSTRILEEAGKNDFSRALVRHYYANGYLSSAWVVLSDFIQSEQARSAGLVGYSGQSNIEVAHLQGSFGEDVLIRPISLVLV